MAVSANIRPSTNPALFKAWHILHDTQETAERRIGANHTMNRKTANEFTPKQTQPTKRKPGTADGQAAPNPLWKCAPCFRPRRFCSRHFVSFVVPTAFSRLNAGNQTRTPKHTEGRNLTLPRSAGRSPPAARPTADRARHCPPAPGFSRAATGGRSRSVWGRARPPEWKSGFTLPRRPPMMMGAN